MTQKSQNASAKDVIYIDVDDEITSIIDKVQASKQRIVALVLPKRASAFQSVVNMKLLKRSADHAKKHVVLITGDASLTPLAGSVGLFVAKSLQSKPEVPDGPDAVNDTDTDKPEAIEESNEPPLDKSKTLAELNQDEEETIELDDPDEPEQDAGSKDKTKDKAGKKAGKNRDKRFKIPNFNKFRLLLLGGVAALILLIAAGVMAFVVLPKARIVISTDSSAINISQDLNLKIGDDTELNVEEAVLPATKEETKKTVSKEVPATGQQNKGETATGSVTMTAKNCSSLATPKDVPAGTGVTANGKTYITQETASFSGSGTFDGACLNFKDTNIAIKAQSGGAAYNVSSASFTVAGRSDVTASGSASGGTDNIIKIVSQADIDKAKQEIGAQNSENIRTELAKALQDAGLMPVESTFITTAPATNQSANVGDEAESVTVTQEVVYSMLGISREDLEKLVTERVNAEIDPTKQSILDYGFEEAAFTSLKTEPNSATVGFQTTVITGSDLDADKIKEQVAGKKANDAKELIKENPGVTEVEVSYSPFWVSSIPKNTSKITVVIEEPRVVEDDNNAQSESNQ